MVWNVNACSASSADQAAVTNLTVRNVRVSVSEDGEDSVARAAAPGVGSFVLDTLNDYARRAFGGRRARAWLSPA